MLENIFTMRELSTRINYRGHIPLHAREKSRSLACVIANGILQRRWMNSRARESRICVREDEWMRRAYFGECVTRTAPGNARGMRDVHSLQKQNPRWSFVPFRFTRKFKLPCILCTNHPNINDEQKRFSRARCSWLRSISLGLRFLLFKTNSLLFVVFLIIIDYVRRLLD